MVVPGLSAESPIDHGIRLGMARSDVVGILGKPDSVDVRDGAQLLGYHAYFEDDPRVSLYYDARYEFMDDLLVAVSISDGE